ncbi:MAG: trypsin-like peptidase domain-containing protein [Planctomycetota bacterium]
MVVAAEPEELRGAITDALKGAGYSVVSSGTSLKELGDRTLRDMLDDEGLFKDVAKKVYDGQGARALVIGVFAVEGTTKNADLGTIQVKGGVTVAAVFGQSGASVGRAQEKGAGSASAMDKAEGKCRDQASAKAIPLFLEKLKEGLGASATRARKMSVVVTDLSENLYESAGLKMRRFLEKTAGASEVNPAYEASEKVMTVSFFFEGTAADLEDKLRDDKRFIRDFLLIQSGETNLTFKLNASRMTLLLVGHDGEKVRDAGKQVLDALKASPDAVDEAASFAQGAYEVKFLSSSGAADLHEALGQALAADLFRQMHLNLMGTDGLVYRFGGALIKVKVVDLGPDSYEDTGLALSNVVEKLAGVDGVVREYSGVDRALTLGVFFSGDRTALENSLRRSHRGLGELQMRETTGDTLTFAFALRSLRFKVRGVQPDVVQREGRAFLARARVVAGVRSLDYDFATDGDFVVSLMWKGTATQFHSAVEKDLKGFQLIRARDVEAEYAVGGKAISLTVEGLADGFYEHTAGALTEKIESLPGCSGLKRTYDASAKTLGFVVFFSGDARQLEDALKGKQGGLGELTVKSTGEDKLLLSFALREMKVAITGSDAESLKEFGSAVGAALKGIEGVAEAKWTYDESQAQFVFALMTKMDAPALHAAVLRASASHAMASKLKLVVARENSIDYRLGALTISGTVEVRHVPSGSLAKIADPLVAALKALPGVLEAAKTYDAASETLTLAVKFTGTAAELDDALWNAIKGKEELAELSPGGASPGMVSYDWRSGEQALVVTVTGVIPSAVDANAKLVKDAVAIAGEVKIESQSYSDKTAELSFALKTKQRAHDVDELIRATPGALVLLDSGPGALRYEASPSVEQLMMLELREVDADRMKTAGTAFVAMLKGLKGVAGVRNEYMADRKAMSLMVTFAGRPVDLDGAIWAGTAGKEEFRTLYPGDLSMGILVYEFREQPVASSVGIAVNGVRPTAFAEVKTSVAGALEGVAGVKDLAESYDDTIQVYSVSVMFEGRPADFLAQFSKNFTARPGGSSYALKRSMGAEIVYEANVKVQDKSEFAIQVAGWREKEDADLGAALVAAVTSVAGLENVKGSYRGDLFAFVVTCTTRLDGAAVDDAVRKALAANAKLARLRVGGLRDGMLTCGLEPPPAAGGTPATPPPAADSRPSLSDLVQRVDAGVVFIQASLRANKDQAWIGSGYVASPQGHILTNHHVVTVSGPDGKPVDSKEVKIRVKLADGRWFAASIVAADAELDAAVLRIKAADLPALEMGDSDALKVGQDIFVIGNPLGLEHSVTTGIVSAFGRMGGRIQTNALINHGNSGGPAFSMDGKVCAIAVSGAVANYAYGDGATVEVPQPGINFLIPVNQLRPLLEKAGQ